MRCKGAHHGHLAIPLWELWNSELAALNMTAPVKGKTGAPLVKLARGRHRERSPDLPKMQVRHLPNVV